MVKLTDKQLDEILSALSKNKKNKKKKKRKIRKKKVVKVEDPFSPKKVNFLNRNIGGGGGYGNFVPFQQQPVITKVDVLSSDKDNKYNQQMDYFARQINMIKDDSERLREATNRVDTKTNLLAYPLKQIFDAVNNPLSNVRPMNPNFRVQEVDRNDGIGNIPRNDSLETMMGIQDQSYVEEEVEEVEEVEEEQEPTKLQFIDSDDEIPTPVQTPASSPKKVKFVREEEEEDDEPEAFFEKLQKMEENRKKRGRPKGSKNKKNTRSSGDEELVNQDFKTPEPKGKGKQKKISEFI
jgi:hypothetical protein